MISTSLRKTRVDNRRDRFDHGKAPLLAPINDLDLSNVGFERSFFCRHTVVRQPLLHGCHVLDVGSLPRPALELVWQQADIYQRLLDTKTPLHVLDGLILATLFYEPSTRTRLSFEAAMHRLGGQVISTPDGAANSSASKGESIADSIRVLCGYSDLIVQRHPAVGSARQAANAADAYGIPVINAGDGAGEHPTQAALDLYTIRAEKGRLDGLHIVLAGDLKHGRTVHSLLRALAAWHVRVTLVAPDELAMPRDVLDSLPHSLPVTVTADLRAATETADVLYMTRLQKERFAEPSQYEQLKDRFVITADFMRDRPDLTLLHPLPRVNEISADVDDLPNAAYFRQAQNGLYVRMALLALLAGRAVKLRRCAMTFYEKFRAAQRINNSWLCVGLDPTDHPATAQRDAASLQSFCEQVIDATADLVCAYKLNLAHWLRLGGAGIDALQAVLQHVPPALLTVLDAKFGDIDSTAAHYAAFAFETLQVDAVTLSPYVGSSALTPFLADPVRGAFVLCRTSNLNGNEFQRVGQPPLYEQVARQTLALADGYPDRLGLVVGATQPDDLQRIRLIAPSLPFLIPGLGMQGGSLAAAAHSDTANGIGALINVGRDILYTERSSAFAAAVRRQALGYRTRINQQRAHG